MDYNASGKHTGCGIPRAAGSSACVIGVLFTVVCAFLRPTIVRALESDPGSKTVPYAMEAVVVTATRAQTPRQEVAANISVITREDIEKMPVSSVAEVLQHLPGVYVEFNGGPGSDASGVRIQGSETRHVVVFQDGVPLNQLANPLTDLNYLPVDAIDRIEVYKGAASSAWGSALGGVINIITKNPDPQKPAAIDVRTSYGEFQTSKSRGTVSGTVNGFGYLVSLTHDESHGFIEHTEYKQDAVYAKINYDLGTASRINFAYFYDEGQNADPVLNFPAFWDDIRRRRTYQRLLFETLPSDDFVVTLEGRHHRYNSHIDDVYNDGSRAVYNDYLDETYGFSGRINWKTAGANTFNFGFDGDWGRYDWVNYTEEYRTRNSAAYVNDTLNVGSFSFNAGGRYDDSKEFGGAFSPSIGAVYRLSDRNALIRAQIAKGFSAPPAAWVHDPVFGNPDLDPESSRNYQLGGEVYFFKNLKFELNLFRADVDDLIRFNSTTNKYENIDKVRRQGLEGSVSATLDFGLTLSLGASYVDVEDKNTGQKIEDIPRKQFNVAAIYAHNLASHSVLGKYIDHNSSYPETRDKVFIFDYLLKVGLPFPERYGKTSLFGAVYNLFNTAYLYRAVWPKPDRWLEAGVRFEY